MNHLHIGESSHNSLDFACAASPEPPALELVERKVCEGLCGGCFYRPVPANAREGVKVCDACRTKMRPSEVPAKWDSRRGDLFSMRAVKQLRRAS